MSKNFIFNKPQIKLVLLALTIQVALFPNLARSQVLSAILSQIGPIASRIPHTVSLSTINGIGMYPLSKFSLDIPRALSPEGRFRSSGSYVYNGRYDSLVTLRVWDVARLPDDYRLVSPKLTRKGYVGFALGFSSVFGYSSFTGYRNGQKFKNFVYVSRGSSTEVPLTIIVDEDANFPSSSTLTQHLASSALKIKESCQYGAFPIENSRSSTMSGLVNQVRSLSLDCPGNPIYFRFSAAGVVDDLRVVIHD
jgi:hypothetical protein